MANIGKSGEAKFKDWCSSVDIVANSSNEDDRRGWDFLIELPIETSNFETLDNQTNVIEAKVQVKTTQKVKNSVALKMSTLDPMLKYNLACFFCFIRVDDDCEVVDVYLRHMDDDILFRGLKKLRECQVKNKTLSKASISISFDENHRISSPYGDAIINRVRKVVGNRDSYIAKKQEKLKKFGYEEKAFTVNFTVKKEFNADYMLSSAMGFNKSIPVEKGKVTDHRFAMPIILPEKLEGSTISIGEIKGRKCSLQFYFDKSSIPISLSGELILSPFHFDTPKLVFKTPSIILSWQGEQFHMDAHSSEKKRIGYYDLVSFAEVLKLLCEPNRKPVVVDLITEDEVHTLFKIPQLPEKQIQETFSNYISSVEKFILFLDEFSIKDVMASLESIVLQEDFLLQYDLTKQNFHPNSSISFGVNGDPFMKDVPAHFYLAYTIEYKNKVNAIIFRCSGISNLVKYEGQNFIKVAQLEKTSETREWFRSYVELKECLTERLKEFPAGAMTFHRIEMFDVNLENDE